MAASKRASKHTYTHTCALESNPCGGCSGLPQSRLHNSKSVQLYSFYTGHLDRVTSEEVAWKLVIGDMHRDSNY